MVTLWASRHILACLGVLALATASATESGRIDIHAKRLGDANVVSAGYISYDDNLANFTANSDFPEGKYCIQSSEFPCFSLASHKGGPIAGTFTLFLGPKGVENLAYFADNQDTAHAEISRVIAGPEPDYSAATQAPKNIVTQKVKRTKVVEVDGQQVEVEEEIEEVVPEDNRLYIQKYWIYLIIPLVVLMLTPEDKEEAKE